MDLLTYADDVDNDDVDTSVNANVRVPLAATLLAPSSSGLASILSMTQSNILVLKLYNCSRRQGQT